MTWAAYAAAGFLALQLALPPGYASPLFPSAGIALAAVLVYGRAVVPAVMLGSFTLNLSLAAQRGQLGLVEAIVLPALIALGAGAQAWIGAALVRRFTPRRLALTEPRDIGALFGLGALAACMVSASVATAALGLTGTVPREYLMVTWFTWWAGDALGASIAAPVWLTLIGRPRADWAARRWTVGLPLVLVTMLLSLAILQIARWDDDRLRNAFGRESAGATSTIAARLQEPMVALEAVRGVFIASEDVNRNEMHRASAPWLVSGKLQAIGWIEHVPRDAVPALEAKARAEGQAGFKVFNLDGGAPTAGDVFALRFLEPLPDRAGALGLNLQSVPAAWDAIDASAGRDRAVVSREPGLPWAAPQEGGNVTVYRALFNGNPATEAERKASMIGAVFVTARLDALLREVTTEFPSHLQLCIIDSTPEAPRRRLAGTVGCESGAADGRLEHLHRLAFAGSQWELSATSRPADMPESRDSRAWLFSLVSLLGAAMLGALLLIVTGRTRRIETAVLQRTTELEREIGERAQTESALRDSEQRFRNIFDNVPIGVVFTDLDGQVKQTNPAFREMLCIGADEQAEVALERYTHPDDWAQDDELSRRLVAGELPTSRVQKRMMTSDGRTLWVRSTVSLLRDAAGEPYRLLGVVEDITEHLRLEEAERAREVAESSNLAKSEFLSRMSHELRTPLNAMLGFAQLLELDKRHPLADAQRPWVAQIQSAGWHLLEMINDVLDLSRIESGNLRLKSEPIDLPALLQGTRSMIERDAQQRGIVVTQDLSEGATRVLGDATRVKQILTNLLSNAVKYNNDGGRIHIASRLRDPDKVVISVTDSGLGMTTEQLAGLFQPFNRLGRERSGQQGTGIGLVISQRLAEVMGGTLHARSVADGGSSFILTLPGVVDPDTVRSDLDPLHATSSNYRYRIVHYVEDNETNVEVMRGILAQRLQVRLDVSVTGLDGLAAIRNRRPDLILLDMHLPDIDGMELLRHLKAGADTADIPVVVVSADALPAQIDAALQAGAARYLTKPVSVAELLATVDETLGAMQTRFG